MSPRRNIPILFSTAVLAAAIGAGWLTQPCLHAEPAASYATALPPEKLINHALNRLAFGPRPGDAEKLRQQGVRAWVEAQLHPETIDDGAVEGKLRRLTNLTKPPQALMLAFAGDTAAFIKQMVKDNQLKRDKGGALVTPAANGNPPDLKPEQARLLEMMQQSGFHLGDSVEPLGELQDAKIARAVESSRQLQEVLVDFWSNHFNLDVKKGPVRALKIVDERDVIRPHVFGKFRDLLGASAKSPAMLFYLDNASSSREYTIPPNRRQLQGLGPKNNKNKRGGINENYARELMELHTLGVDGGYTQHDVQEVARCFTGWTFERRSGEFRFVPFMHDNGAKTVLGHAISAGGGQGDGETVLDILATHPSTARFITRKLCVRLVSDNPPATLIDRAAKVFLDSGGDLRELTRAIVTAPEFFSTAAYRAKIKSPFEYAVSSVRALGGTVELPDPAQPMGRLRLLADGSVAMGGRRTKGMNGKWLRKSLAAEIGDMGQPLFSYQAPTGYPEDSSHWVSTGALVARLNFALALTSEQVAQVTIKPISLLDGVRGDDHNEVLQRLIDQLVGGDVSVATRATLLKEMPADTPADPARMAALVLGSPEFQRR